MKHEIKFSQIVKYSEKTEKSFLHLKVCLKYALPCLSRTVSHCFRQLRLVKGCIKSLPFEASIAAFAAFVTSQVDRCNSLLVGAPKRLLDCLKSVLNAAARLLCNRRKYDHTTPLLRHSVMFYTGSQFLFASSLRSVCWCTSRFMGLCLGTCASTVKRRIHPLRG